MPRTLKPGWPTAAVLVAGAATLAVIGLGKIYPLAGCTIVSAVVLALIATHFVARARSRQALIGWAGPAGWTPVDPAGRHWPWQSLHLRGDSEVVFAWERVIDGLTVTFGEITWTDGAFGGAVVTADGKGTFVLVRLPQAEPPMAMRLPFTYVGDSPRLEQPALRQAYLDGAIPPFTVQADQLFTIEPRDSWLDAKKADHAVQRALLVVRLLDVGPDTVIQD